MEWSIQESYGLATVNFFLPADKLRTFFLYCQGFWFVYNWPIRKQDWGAHGPWSTDAGRRRMNTFVCRIALGLHTFVSRLDHRASFCFQPAWFLYTLALIRHLTQRLSWTNTKALHLFCDQWCELSTAYPQGQKLFTILELSTSYPQRIVDHSDGILWYYIAKIWFFCIM